MEALAPLLITFGLMWLLLIRPQQRRVRAHQSVVSSLEPGDDIITAGGIHGTIVRVGDDTLQVEVSPGVVLRILRGAVSQRVAADDPATASSDTASSDTETASSDTATSDTSSSDTATSDTVIADDEK